MNWLRWYVGTVTDAKLHKASRIAHCRRSAVIAAWAAILEEARRHGDSGDIGEVDPSWLAGQIDEPTTKCAAIVKGMETVGLISKNQGLTNVAAFSRRQFASDNSTMRVRRFRAKALKTHETTARGNVTVTQGETHQNRTEVGKESDSTVVAISPKPEHGSNNAREEARAVFARLWALQRLPGQKRAKVQAEKAWMVACRRAPPKSIWTVFSNHQNAWEFHGYEVAHIPYLSTWLNQRRWEDDDLPGPRAGAKTNGNGKREDWYGRRVLERAVRRAEEAEDEPRSGLLELESRAPVGRG